MLKLHCYGGLDGPHLTSGKYGQNYQVLTFFSVLEYTMAKPDSCGLGPAFQVVGGKWKALILWWVCQEPRRFGEL